MCAAACAGTHCAEPLLAHAALCHSQACQSAAQLLAACALLTLPALLSGKQAPSQAEWAAQLPNALVGGRSASSRDDASNIAARVPRVPRVHAQHVQHVPEVQSHGCHPQRYLVWRQLCTQPAQRISVQVTESNNM